VHHRLSSGTRLACINAAFVLYSLIRGASTGWYPYPRLDPSKVGGYTGVAAYGVAITVAFVRFAAFLTWIGNYLREKQMVIAN
jgi:hypothetical protein